MNLDGLMSFPTRLSRRSFLVGSLAGVSTALHSRLRAGETKQPDRFFGPQRVTLAQAITRGDVTFNLDKAKAVFEQAAKDRADWILFPELFLTGTHNGVKYRQAEVARAFARMQAWCRQYHVIGLIGTGWEEEGKHYNQVRVVDAQGELVSVYAKTCLTYSDAEEGNVPGPISMTHRAGGIRFGILICNDLWVTPGFTDGPDPRLSLKLARAGVQVIFHAVGSGNDVRYRGYHENNLLVRAAEAKCPIVVVNGFVPPESSVTSGVVGVDFQYLDTLPRDRETIKTVVFTPKGV